MPAILHQSFTLFQRSLFYFHRPWLDLSTCLLFDFQSLPDLASTKMKVLTATLFLLVSSTTNESIIDMSSRAPQVSKRVPMISHTNNSIWNLGNAGNSSGGNDNLSGTIDKGSSSSSSPSLSFRGGGCGVCQSGDVKVVNDVWSLAVFGAISLVGVVM